MYVSCKKQQHKRQHQNTIKTLLSNHTCFFCHFSYFCHSPAQFQVQVCEEFYCWAQIHCCRHGQFVVDANVNQKIIYITTLLIQLLLPFNIFLHVIFFNYLAFFQIISYNLTSFPQKPLLRRCNCNCTTAYTCFVYHASYIFNINFWPKGTKEM